MKGYVATKDGVYSLLQTHLKVGNTYIFENKSTFTLKGFLFYSNIDDINIQKVYDKKTKIFEIKYDEKDVFEMYGLKYINHFKVIKVIDHSDYKDLFKKLKFDNQNKIISDLSNGKEFIYKDNKLKCVKIGDIIWSEYFYDKDNLIHFKTDSYQEWYEYDNRNNMVKFKDSNVTEESYTYDEKNRLKTIKISPGRIEKTFTYDDNDNLILEVDNLGKEKYAQYDSRKNLINFKTNDNYEFVRQYDEDNNLIYHKSTDGTEEYKITII